MIAFIVFWIGFCFHSYAVSFFKESQFIFFFFWGVQAIGLALMVPSAMFLVYWKFENNYLRIVFSLTMGWYLFIFFRGFSLSFDFINFLLFDPLLGLFLYLIPFVILFPQKIIYLKVLFSAISVLGILYLVNNLLFFQITILRSGGNVQAQIAVEYFSGFLAIASGFILLTYKYHSRWRNILALSVLVFAFFLAVLNGRRGLLFISASIMVASYLVFVVTNKSKPLNIILSFFLVFFLIIYGRDTYIKRQADTFRRINERLFERTRTGVEEFFYRDMGTVDWIIGRGITGQYYCPGIAEVQGKFTVFRSIIETGYLQFVLKGGLVNVFLFFLIMLPAAFKGMFFSKNLLSKASAIWIILFLGYSYPIVINTFSLYYVIMWMAVAICFSKEIRAKRDEEIRNILKIKYRDALRS